jgi:hypothetical protein
MNDLHIIGRETGLETTLRYFVQAVIAIFGTNDIHPGNGYRGSHQALSRYSCIGRIRSGLHGTILLYPHRSMLINHKAFGFATDEFQVTPERLGVYLPVVCASLSFYLSAQ